MRKSLKRIMFAAVPLILTAGMSAYAASVTFDFNSLAAGAPSSGGIGVDASIQNYMNHVLATTTGFAGVTVTVTGAIADSASSSGQTSGGLDWTGDGHTVGPTGSPD